MSYKTCLLLPRVFTRNVQHLLRSGAAFHLQHLNCENRNTADAKHLICIHLRTNGYLSCHLTSQPLFHVSFHNGMAKDGNHQRMLVYTQTVNVTSTGTQTTPSPPPFQNISCMRSRSSKAILHAPQHHPPH